MNQLLLVPTEPEMQILLPQLRGFAADSGCAGSESGNGNVALCGFGQIISAARAVMLIARYQPKSLILAGIAGALDPRLTIGNAYEFDRVEVDGVGVGVAIPPGCDFGAQPACRSTYRSAAEIGWTHWPGSDDSPVIGDAISLRPSRGSGMPAPDAGDADYQGLGLLSVCAASADAAQAEGRRQRYPTLAAEDMEGFGVAAACRLAGIPLRIVRGISNRAGDRDLSHWQTVTALESVARLLNARMPFAAVTGPTSQSLPGSEPDGARRA
ncbi:MAG: futalosine hydrolase [Planctomycetaceae bacterium]|nr:MAG: futalosine hydrolase [Planctomycetaceae bacterium]